MWFSYPKRIVTSHCCNKSDVLIATLEEHVNMGMMMNKKILLSAGIAGMLFGIPTMNANAAVSIQISAGDRPSFFINSAPSFVYLRAQGFSVTVDSPYDIIYYSSRYYLYYRGHWYRSNYYNGPWIYVQDSGMPVRIRRHRWDDIRRYRDTEYRRSDFRNNQFQRNDDNRRRVQDQRFEAVNHRTPGQPNRPADRPNGPGQPNRPADRPNGPGQPNRPADRPNGPGQPNRPADRPNGPGQPNRPADRPNGPGQQNRPADRPKAPAQLNKPADRPNAPAQQNRPADRPKGPAQQNRPADRPNAPAQQNRPADRPKGPAQQNKPDEKQKEAPGKQNDDKGNNGNNGKWGK